MNKNESIKKLCHHHNECGNMSIYEILDINDQIINVCEDCDEMYSMCVVCGRVDITDEMYYYNEEDELRTCNKCSEMLDKEQTVKFHDLDETRYNIIWAMHEYKKSNFEDISHPEWNKRFYDLLQSVLDGMESD